MEYGIALATHAESWQRVKRALRRVRKVEVIA